VTTALSNFLLGSSSKGKHAWTEEEDAKLREMVEKFTTTNWTSIAEAFPDRSGKQCRERWHNHLQEGILKGSWSNDEDAIICALQQRLGNQWSKITKYLPGRTDNSVKNRFHALQRSRKRYTDADVPAGFILPLFVTDASLLVDVETTQSTKMVQHDQQGAQWVHHTGGAYDKEQTDADLGIYEEEYEYEEQYTESPYQYQPNHATYSAPVSFSSSTATTATAMSTGHMVPPPPPPPPRLTAPQTPMQQQHLQRLGQDGQPLSGAASPLSAAAMSIGDLDEMLDGEEGGDDEAFGFSADCIHVPTFATYEWGSNSFAHKKTNGGCNEEEEEDMDVQEGNQTYCSSFMQKIIAPKPVSSSGFSSMSFCDPSAGGAYTGEAQQAYSLEMAQVDPTTYHQQHYQYQHQQQQYYQQQQQQQYQGGGFSAFVPSSSFCGNQ